MKSIINWIAFVPVCILTSLLMVFIGIDGSGAFLGLNVNSAAEIVIYSVLGLLIFCFVVSLFDRSTSPMHLLKKNPFCGVTAVASAFLLSATAALDFTTMVNTSDFGVMDVITSLFTVATAVSLLFVALNHFSGKNTSGPISILYLSIPLWCAVHLISRFLDHTATPVAAAETLDLVMFVGLALFSVYAMMIHAMIPGKNAVKASICMGFPTVAIIFAYGISEIFKVAGTEAAGFLAYIPAAAYIMLGLYTLGFVAELSFKAKTVDEQVILEPVEDYEEYDEDFEDAEDEDVAAPVSDEINTAQNEYPETDDDIDEYEAVVSESVVPRAIEEDEADDAASEIFRAAKESDSKSKKDFSVGSEEEMIIRGENAEVKAQKHPVDKAPTGKTLREAVMIEDDFILSVDAAKIPQESSVAEETLSDLIDFEETKTPSKKTEKKSYVSRLDEIDRLIISIQGGDSDKSHNSDE